MPVFTLEAQEGRLFKPLAFTKNFSMIIAAVLAITLDPAMRLLFTHMKHYTFRPRWLSRIANAVLVGKIHSEENHPISRPLMRIYHPMVEFVLRHQWATICRRRAGGGAHRAGLLSGWGRNSCRRSMKARCSTCRPRVPGISVTEAQQLLQVQDKILKTLSRSGAGLRQGGTGRNRHRSGALFHDGDHHPAEAARPVAQGAALVFRRGRRSGCRTSCGAPGRTTGAPRN